MLNVIAVAGASILAVPTILTDPLRTIKLFPDATISALPEAMTVPVPKVSGVLGASRFAVPTIVTVPIPSVNGLPVTTSVTASAVILGLPILATKLLPVAIIVTVLSAPTRDIGNCDIASKPKFLNVLKRRLCGMWW